MSNLSAPFLTLARQLLALPTALDAPHYCPHCREFLPLFITEETAGEPVDDLYSEIAYHLDICQTCLREYESLSSLIIAALFDEETP